MSQEEFIARLVRHLNEAGIPYMIAGSVGSNFHGEPRATNDIDVIIAPSAEQLRRFLKSLGKDYYVSADTAQEAMINRTMFNVIDLKTAWKADLIFRTNEAFDRSEFDRRLTVEVSGTRMNVISAEDAILSKLRWFRASSRRRNSETRLAWLRPSGTNSISSI